MLEVNVDNLLYLLSIVKLIKVKARERKCDISGYLEMKKNKWKKQWLEVTEFALYVFEKHEVMRNLFKSFIACDIYWTRMFHP